MKKLLLLALVTSAVLIATAQVPQQINYQGVARNSVGSIIANQNISLRLSVKDGSVNGPVIYSESRNLKTNSYGLFVTAIGSSGATNVTGNFSSINWSNGIKFLQVEIDPQGSSNYIDMGTAQLLSVPYALYANAAPPVGNAGGDLIGNYPSPFIRDGVITNSKIGDGEISASKLQPGVIPDTLPPGGSAGGDLTGTYPNPFIKVWAIDSSKLADNSVGTSKILDASVTAQKLAPGTIPTSLSPSGNAGGDLAGTYPNPTINNGVVDNNKLADNSISTIKIQNASVTSVKIAPGVIPTTLPPSGAAGGDLTGTYPNPNIANNAITNQKIADGAVTNTKLGDNSVSTSKIQDGAITASKLAPGLIPSGTTPTGIAGGDLTGTYPNPTLNSGVVDNTKLADNSVSTTKLQDASVTSIKLAQGVIPTSLPPTGTAGGDLSGTYPNPTIAANAVTTTKIADNSITTSKVVDGSITSTKLAAGVIPTSLPPSGTAGGDLTGTYPNPTLNTGVVDNTKLADNSVSTTKIQDASVTSSKLASGVIPTSLPPNGSAGGDLSGNYPNPTLDKIKGITLSSTAPTTGQVLKYDGTQWIPSADNVGSGGSPTGSAGGDLSGNYPNPNIASGAVTTPKIANGSIVTPKIADGAVTVQKLAAGVIPTSLPPSGAAGGDLSGTYPNPVVSQIQGVSISNTAPVSGQVLKFNGTSWVPGPDNTGSGGSPTGTAGGDLSGTYPNPTIASNAVTTIKIADGSVTSNKLAAGVIPTSLPPSGTAGGDLTGTYPNPTLNTGVVDNTKLADNSVSTTKLQDASVTSSKLAPGVIPTSLPPSGIAGGDLSSSYPNPVVSKIRGITVANVAPTTGQVLSFDGTQWTPSTVSGGGGSLTLPYSSTTSSSSSLFSLTNSGSGSALTGTNSTTASNVTGVVGAISSTTAGAMSAGIKGVNNGTGTNGIGVYGVHSGNGYGVYGNSNGGTGVFGNSPSGFGLYGTSSSGTGVYGESTSGNAGSFNVSDINNPNDALFVNNAGQGNAINSYSEQSNGVLAVTNSSAYSAIQAFNNAGGTGIWGITFGTSGPALKATNTADGGTALQADLWGPTGDIAVFQLNGANQARINANGKGFFNGGTQNSGADVAESFDVEGDRNGYEPGDVLVISQSSDRTVEKSQTSYSTLVAGVYATKPGVLLTEKTNQTQIDAMVPMGVIGVIPTKVCLEGGSIKRGDLIVTSSTPGVAMKADPDKVKIGQVIGKALEDYSATGIGKIKVLVSIK